MKPMITSECNCERTLYMNSKYTVSYLTSITLINNIIDFILIHHTNSRKEANIVDIFII